MKKIHNILALFAICVLIGCNNKESKDAGKILHMDHIVDLTHTLTPDFPFIPVKKLTYPFELIPMKYKIRL